MIYVRLTSSYSSLTKYPISTVNGIIGVHYGSCMTCFKSINCWINTVFCKMNSRRADGSDGKVIVPSSILTFLDGGASEEKKEELGPGRF